MIPRAARLAMDFGYYHFSLSGQGSCRKVPRLPQSVSVLLFSQTTHSSIDTNMVWQHLQDHLHGLIRPSACIFGPFQDDSGTHKSQNADESRTISDETLFFSSTRQSCLTLRTVPMTARCAKTMPPLVCALCVASHSIARLTFYAR